MSVKPLSRKNTSIDANQQHSLSVYSPPFNSCVANGYWCAYMVHTQVRQGTPCTLMSSYCPWLDTCMVWEFVHYIYMYELLTTQLLGCLCCRTQPGQHEVERVHQAFD